MDINVFLLFCSFVSSNWEREREGGIYKFGYKGEIAPKLLILFFDGVPLENLSFLRANRLYAIFNTGLKNSGPWCPRYVFVFFTRSNGYGSVRYEPLPKTDFSSRFLSPTGRRCHFRFRVSANHLASLSFSLPVSGDLRLLSTNICWYPLCDLHSFLTVSLTVCHSSFQREDSINLISIVSVGYHVTQGLIFHKRRSPWPCFFF